MLSDLPSDRFLVRAAQLPDAEGLARIAARAYQQYLPLMDRPPAPMQADYSAHIAKDDVFVACLEDRLVGYAVIIRAEDDGYWLDNIAIDPDVAGRGLGKTLLGWIESWLSERTDSYQLYTNIVMHRNIDWYQTLGFKQTGHRTVDGYQRIYFSKNLTT